MTAATEAPQASAPSVCTAAVDTRGPYDLREVALMGFGHRNEQSFDGVMRLAFCVDGDYERQVGVEVRQQGERLDLLIHPGTGSEPLDATEVEVVTAQVARVLSVDQDGEAFARVCQSDPVLARLQAAAPGFRPALFYSPYEAAVWSILSARRARPQGITIRTRLAEQSGAPFVLAGVRTAAVPSPSALLGLDSIAGLPADRVTRLHAIAAAAQRGELSASRLTSMEPGDALLELQRLPGIGPFYSALIVIRACGVADVLPVVETAPRLALRELYGLDHDLSDAEYADFAERWRPFRTWAAVLMRAVGHRLES